MGKIEIVNLSEDKLIDLYNESENIIKFFNKKYRISFGDETAGFVDSAFFYAVNEFKKNNELNFNDSLKITMDKLLNSQVEIRNKEDKMFIFFCNKLNPTIRKSFIDYLFGNKNSENVCKSGKPRKTIKSLKNDLIRQWIFCTL